MAGRQDIRAGGAFVELSLKGTASFAKGLKAAGDRLKDFGSGMARIGGVITAAGAGLLAPFAASIKHFSDFGSSLKDMSGRTGASAQLLAELGHAAEMTGATFEDVEIGMRGMVKKGLNPANFKQVAAGIMAIQDPTLRAQAAMDTFGKSGLKLLPMMADLGALAGEANMLGLVPTQQQIEAADRLGDAMDVVKKSVMGVAFQIGSALAESVTEAAGVITKIVSTAAQWVKQNKELVVTVAKVGVGLVVAGAVITGLGVAIAGVGFVLSGIGAAIGALLISVGAIMSPIGAVVALLVLSGVAWSKWSDSGKQAVASVVGVLKSLLGTFEQTFGGIADAIMAGDLAGAGAIAMAGLKVAFLQGVAAIVESVGGAFGDFLGALGTQIAGGDFAGAWDTAVIGMSSVWNDFCEGIIAVFTQASRAIIQVWQNATTDISNMILEASKEGGRFADIASAVLGVDMGAEQRKSDKIHAGNVSAKQRLLTQAKNDLAKADASGMIDRGGGMKQSVEEVQNLIANLERDLAALGSGPENVLATAKAGAAAELAGIANAGRAGLDKMDLEAQIKARKSAIELAKVPKVGVAGMGAEVDAAQADLDRLTKEAADKRAKLQEAAQAGQDKIVDAAAPVAGRQAGSFSAAAALAIGQGGGPIERVESAVKLAYKAINEAKKQAKEDAAAMRKAIQDAGVIA